MIDLRQVGKRVITSSGVTGALGSDNLTPPAGLAWICDTMTPYLATDVSSDMDGPLVALTFQLDQSSVAMMAATSAAARVRLRIR